MKVEISLFLNVSNSKNATVVLNRLKKSIDLTVVRIEDYHKGGKVCFAETQINSNSWSGMVYKTLEFAQKFGMSWTLDEHVSETISLHSEIFIEPTINFATLTITKTDFKKPVKKD